MLPHDFKLQFLRVAYDLACPAGFVSIAGRCYHFSKTVNVDQATAASKCTSQSSSLATFQTENEWNQVKMYFIAFPTSYAIERGFSAVVQLLSKQRNRLKITERWRI